jgi:hypothetical protein
VTTLTNLTCHQERKRYFFNQKIKDMSKVLGNFMFSEMKFMRSEYMIIKVPMTV